MFVDKKSTKASLSSEFLLILKMLFLCFITQQTQALILMHIEYWSQTHKDEDKGKHGFLDYNSSFIFCKSPWGVRISKKKEHNIYLICFVFREWCTPITKSRVNNNKQGNSKSVIIILAYFLFRFEISFFYFFLISSSKIKIRTQKSNPFLWNQKQIQNKK